MILKRFYDDKLAQASYLIGCAATGNALVVDANRDVSQYIAAARAEGLRVTHVTETHIHADYVSGSRELAAATGARLHLSDEGGDDWRYAFANDAGAVLLHDGDSFNVGNIRIDVLHTPGHTPEHLSFVVTDTAGADAPMGVCTGDFIFVGDVGRPDLLERAAKHAGTMEAGARTLFASITKFKAALPDYVQLWPGHGAGSACGKSLGAVPQTTLGYEARFNWALGIDDEQEFVDAVLAGQPEPPMYFAEMKRINRDGPRVLGALPKPVALDDDRLAALLDAGVQVIDTRPAKRFAAGHVPGTLSIPLGQSFTTWAGSVLAFDRDFALVIDEPTGSAAAAALRDLAMIGLDRGAGVFGTSVIDAWARAHTLATVPDIAQLDLDGARADGAEVIDVRNGSEYEAGHIPGSRNVPLGRLAERLDTLPRDRPLVVHCQSGARAGVAIGLLRAEGFDDVRHLAGDWGGWNGERATGPEPAGDVQPDDTAGMAGAANSVATAPAGG